MNQHRLTNRLFATHARSSYPHIRPTAALCVVALLLIAAAAEAQRGRNRQNRAQFSDSTTVTVVEVPVQVIGGGDPIKNLTRADFELFDGRKKVPITGFDIVDLSVVEGKATQEPVPVSARRHFLILFDLFFTPPDSVGRAKQAAADLVLTALHPTDLAAVATFDTRPRLVLGFTSDRSQLRQAIRSLGNVELGESIRDPLGLVIGDLGGDLMAGDGLEIASEAQTGRAAVDAASEQVQTRRELRTLEGRANRGEEAAKIAALTAGMSELAAWMQSVEGRKHVVFLSEGFDSSVLVGNQSLTEEDRQLQREQQDAVLEGRTQEVDFEQTFGDSSAQSAMNRMLTAFREANCSIQAVDVSGRVQTQAQSNRAGLSLMSSDTGGEMFANFTDLGEAMSEVLERTSVTYLLAFQPDNLKQDGKFRKLRVRLNDAPRGTRVIHRPGYYPPTPYAQTNPFQRILGSAQEVMGGVEIGHIEASVLATGFPAPSGKAYAPVLIEARGSDLLDGFQGDTLPLELYAYALDENGIVRDFFASRMGLDMAGSSAALQQSGLKYWGHFDLDPGDYSVRVLLRNDATGRRALTTALLQVPGEAPALQPPLFPEAPGKWLLLREDESEQRKDVAFPFLRDGAPFIPAARPDVTAGGETPISLVGMNLADGPVSVRTHVFRPSGEEVAQGGEVVLEPGAKGSAGLSQLSGSFVAGKSLAAGEYTLSVTVIDAANAEHSSSTAFRVL